MVRGDFGESLLSNSPVLPLLLRRYVFTLELTMAAVTLATLLGITTGVISAARRHSIVDHLVMVVSLVGVSTPAFSLGIMLILVFGLHFDWLPTGGTGGLRYLVLPAFSLGAFSWGVIARMTRASMLEVLNQEYVRTARAKGLHYSSVLLKHALKNALLPVLTVVGLQFGYLLAGAVVTESVFNWPGVGRLLVSSVLQRDFPVVQGAVLLIAANFVTVNMLVDVAYAWADPRIRY
jgi:ABC-type dipeptide/oligopeptide/nickel transport system permease component